MRAKYIHVTHARLFPCICPSTSPHLVGSWSLTKCVPVEIHSAFHSQFSCPGITMATVQLAYHTARHGCLPSRKYIFGILYLAALGRQVELRMCGLAAVVDKCHISWGACCGMVSIICDHHTVHWPDMARVVCVGVPPCSG